MNVLMPDAKPRGLRFSLGMSSRATAALIGSMLAIIALALLVTTLVALLIGTSDLTGLFGEWAPAWAIGLSMIVLILCSVAGVVALVLILQRLLHRVRVYSNGLLVLSGLFGSTWIPWRTVDAVVTPSPLDSRFLVFTHDGRSIPVRRLAIPPTQSGHAPAVARVLAVRNDWLASDGEATDPVRPLA